MASFQPAQLHSEREPTIVGHTIEMNFRLIYSLTLQHLTCTKTYGSRERVGPPLSPALPHHSAPYYERRHALTAHAHLNYHYRCGIENQTLFEPICFFALSFTS